MPSLGRVMRAGEPNTRGAGAWREPAIVVVWIALLALAVCAGDTRLAGVCVLAAAAMGIGALWAARMPSADSRLDWVDALAAGAMIASAAVFLLPAALHADTRAGAAGAAVGLTAGLSLIGLIRLAGRRANRIDRLMVALMLHGVGAGLALGIVDAHVPSLSALLGAAIVSHKLPAGYAAARHLARRGARLRAVVWPACAVGLAAVPAALLSASGTPAGKAMLLGVATGLFAFVALDFMPAAYRRDRGLGWRVPLASAVGVLLVVGLRGLVA